MPETIALLWQNCQENFRRCSLSWVVRLLPHLSQKSLVLKVFAASKLWYLAQILPVPGSMVKCVERLMGNFLWRGRAGGTKDYPYLKCIIHFRKGVLPFPTYKQNVMLCF